jgi:hypothetical protein
VKSLRDNCDEILRSGVFFLLLCLFSLVVPVSAATQQPAAEDINSLSVKSQKVYDDFLRQSFGLRIKYEFNSNFIDRADGENLYKIAKTASDELAGIEREQRRLKQIIEDYEADDWDARYGSTGLWKKLSSGLYTTALSRAEADFFAAVSSAQRQEAVELCHKIINRLDLLEEIRDSAYLHFIKARVYALLAKDDSLYQPLAKMEFDWLSERSDIEQALAFRIEIERNKLPGETETTRLDKIGKELANSECADDIELILSLAFLQRNLGRYQSYEKILKQQPQAGDYVGSILLSVLVTKMSEQEHFAQILQDITVFEAELVAKFLWKSEDQQNTGLLQSIATLEEFQTPLILYVTAVKTAEAEPDKAIELLIKASKLQKQKKSDSLDIEAYKIAEQTAQFAYEMYMKGSIDCRKVLDAFKNYNEVSSRQTNGKLEYYYASVLSDCNCPEKGEQVMKDLANGDKGYWSSRAKLDLIKQDIEINESANTRTSDELLSRLKNFITDFNSEDKEFKRIKAEAIAIYCRLLLERNDENSAQQVVDILTEDNIDEPNLYAFKSTALQRLGQPLASAEYLLKACQEDDCRYTHQTMLLLSEIIENVDTLAVRQDNFQQAAGNCRRLAQICFGCLKDLQAGLFLAEISVFAADKNDDELAEVEKLLANLTTEASEQNIGIIRCRARLLTEQQKYEDAAKLWAQICKSRQSRDFDSNTRSFQWWRAIYFELLCWSKLPKTEKQQVLHTIEVLENTFNDIPLLWAEKLTSLKQVYSNTLSASDK